MGARKTKAAEDCRTPRRFAKSANPPSGASSWTAAVLCRFSSQLWKSQNNSDSVDGAMSQPHPPWPHAPNHRLCTRGTYFVTASTYLKEHHFRGKERLVVLHRGLLKVTHDFGWQLEAWAVFSNHYHFVAHSPSDAPNAANLPDMLSSLHAKTGSWVNHLDETPGRKVWFNFRETRLTFQKSLLMRLNYVHQNPVKHGLVPVANQYPWCSARWFESTASESTVKSIYAFKSDKAHIPDEFGPAPEW